METETDGFDALGPSITNTSKVKSGQKRPPPPPPPKTEKKERDVLNSVTTWNVHEDYPRFLAAVGKRLTTAAIVLIKISRTLERDLGAPRQLQVDYYYN